MYILGIETSCDETSCAVLRDRDILSHCTLSSVKQHKRFGGVVPEIAARRQYDYIDTVVRLALKKAGVRLDRIQAIGVVNGPGLVGSLLVGLNFAKALALNRDVPLLCINHLYAHLYAAFLKPKRPSFPFLGFVVSGGHTHLYLVNDFRSIRLVGKTRDDAVGEVYDKIARQFGLGYPGGPCIDKLFDIRFKQQYPFRCGIFLQGFDTSFSGIKTAVVYKKESLEKERRMPLGKEEVKKILSSFQESVVTTLVKTVVQAAERFKTGTIVFGGGVAANQRFRTVLHEAAGKHGLKMYIPDMAFCSDNAAPVAGLAYELCKSGFTSSLHERAYSAMPLSV